MGKSAPPKHRKGWEGSNNVQFPGPVGESPVRKSDRMGQIQNVPKISENIRKKVVAVTGWTVRLESGLHYAVLGNVGNMPQKMTPNFPTTLAPGTQNIPPSPKSPQKILTTQKIDQSWHSPDGLLLLSNDRGRQAYELKRGKKDERKYARKEPKVLHSKLVGPTFGYLGPMYFGL